MEIKECTAIVTGGASGLGEATVRRVVAAGGNAGIIDMDESRGQALAKELGENALFFKADVTNAEQVQAAIDGTVEKFGGIQLAVNCAGVGTPTKVLGKKGPIPLEQFDMIVRINLTGTLNVTRLAAEAMMNNTPNADNEKGLVVNTASVAAFDGQIGQAAYSASKAGVVGMTLPIAREFAEYGIRVNTIAPGLFETPMLAGLPEKAQVALAQMVPFPKRLGKPDEFAMLVEHMIENPVLNGETIRLDGCIRMAAK